MDKEKVAARLMDWTKADMMDAALRLGLPPIRQSARKAEWAAHIAEGLETHGMNLLLLLTLEETEALHQAFGNGTTVAMGNLRTADMNLRSALAMLSQFGVVDVVKGEYRVEPFVSELVDLDEAGWAQQRLQDNLYSFMDGWLLHVGMMPVNELLRRTVDLLELSPDKREAAELLCIALLIAREGQMLWEDDEGTQWAVSAEVEDIGVLHDRLCQPVLRSMDYPAFDEDELVWASRETRVPGSVKLYLPLLEWLEGHGVQEADALIGDAVVLVQNERINEAVEMVMQEAIPADITEANEAVGQMISLFNQMPRWSCKGHSPSVMLEKMNPRRKSVRMPGGNDPCSCGSGRKYKQCCGRRLN